MERLTRRIDGGVTFNEVKDLAKAYSKLADYEDAEEQGRLFISKYGVGQIIFAVIPTDEHEDCNIFCIETYKVLDVSASGTITVDTYEEWTLEDQKEWHVCGTREEAEAKLKELGENNIDK